MVTPSQAVDPGVLRAQERVGRSLRGKWRLDALLGVGGMAAVYAGTHRNGARGAIKMLHPELSVHDHVRSRFLKEGYVANRVDHPGVVRVLDDDVAEDGSLFLVMELLDGESLERRQARLGRLEPDEVLAAADQLLDVLAAAHEKGIVHRDVKPENVFLTRDGAIKVLDFGIARLRELSSEGGNSTKTGLAMGTPAYMPPEQARGRWSEVDGQSDLWAVGATMFTLLTGKVVHHAQTTNEQLLAAMTKPAPPLQSVAPQVPECVAAVVDRALAFQKADRWPNAREMQEAVRRAYHRLHNAPISSHPRLTVPPSVIDRTLLSAGISPGTTGRAVVSGRTGLSLRSLQQIPRRKLAIGAGAVAALAIVVGFVVHSALRKAAPTLPAASAEAAQPPAKAEPAATEAASPTVAPSALPSSSASAEPTAISVTALPREAPPKQAPKPGTVTTKKSAKGTRAKQPKRPAVITTQQNW